MSVFARCAWAGCGPPCFTLVRIERLSDARGFDFIDVVLHSGGLSTSYANEWHLLSVTVH